MRHHTASLTHKLGNGYKAIAPPGKVLPMDSGCQTTLVSALLDGRRVVALQVLCVSVNSSFTASLRRNVFTRETLFKRRTLKRPNASGYGL